MKKEVRILIAEDDAGHAQLIRKNLSRAGIANPVIHFKDGQEVHDFLFRQGEGPHREQNTSYVLLLDIRMPKMDGTEVLEKIKNDHELCKIPVIMITTTDDPREVAHCHEMGCNSYITKPVEYDAFVKAIRQLGLYLSIVQVPIITGDE
ncbi:response regulator [Chitinivibrio alkaliphilus]|uniref:Response regulator receiver protein n=1 Tax=Chitinivibrio alkaliphilus ACht1 TaxID=1313304 RepID=U7D305_9BACT|nr:response regulator [Chitinivibrio alkaliphilus]ERP30864.1 response regulator receiver protein [Chitinivibrio alkaliphilus ACht1]